ENSTGVPPGAHGELVTEVESWDEVASVSYFDKNDAWLEYQQVVDGDEALLDIDPTILPATIRIELIDIAHQSEVQSRLEQRTPVVREVQTAPTNDYFDALEEPSTDTTGCIDPGDTTSTVVETTTSGPTCEAGELVPPTTVANGDPSYDLTEPVAEKLTAIAAAAGACDASAVAALAASDITTTFGPGSGPEDIASWDGDDERFEIITELFNMTHAVTEMPDGSALYVWPAAFAFDAWEEIPAAAMDELLRIYTQEQLDQISQLGSYGGWRIGITEAGEWIFFVAGD
ncbi:MAG: permease-like cell division protein FtsX, partial [Acidimicrobiia bacterium]